jgi:hypothetical protein
MIYSRGFSRISVLFFLALVFVGAELFLLSRKTLTRAPAQAIATEEGLFISGEISNITSQEFILTTSVSAGTTAKKYNVKISSDTTVSRLPPTIPYIVRSSATIKSAAPRLADLRNGMHVKVQGNLVDNNLEAMAVTLPRITHILQATIKDMKKDSLSVEGSPLYETKPTSVGNGQWPPAPVFYTITITPDTEISKEITNPATGETTVKQFKLTELKEEQMIIIYAVTDVVETHNVSAARIEPVL